MLQTILTKINQKRVGKNYSQHYMASRLNISQSYYNKIESGKKTITLQHILLIATVLDIEVAELISPTINQTNLNPSTVNGQQTS